VTDSGGNDHRTEDQMKCSDRQCCPRRAADSDAVQDPRRRGESVRRDRARADRTSCCRIQKHLAALPLAYVPQARLGFVPSAR